MMLQQLLALALAIVIVAILYWGRGPHHFHRDR